MSCFRYLTITIWISIYHKGTPVSFMSINHQIAPITHSLFLFLSVEREIPSAKSHPWVVITKSTSKVIHRVRGCQWRGKKTKLRKPTSNSYQIKKLFVAIGHKICSKVHKNIKASANTHQGTTLGEMLLNTLFCRRVWFCNNQNRGTVKTRV